MAIVSFRPRFSRADLASLYRRYPSGERVTVGHGDAFAFEGGVISKAAGGFILWDEKGYPVKSGRTVDEVMEGII